jgi:putative copper export protein
MTTLAQAVSALHLLFAGLWAGALLFVSAAVVPLAQRSDAGVLALDVMAKRYALLARASTVVIFVTGVHMAATGYTVDSLLAGGRGHLVLTMLGLWVVLMALSEVATARFRRALDQQKIRTAGRESRLLFAAGSVVAVVLLLLGGVLAA